MIDDLYSHAHENTLCKDSRPIKGRNGCNTDLECLHNAKKSCDEDFRCHGIAWYDRRVEQNLQVCYSRENRETTEGETNYGWRTMWREDGILLFLTII